MPQLPVTTVVTPWLILHSISGSLSSARSSWVWVSMKPGASARLCAAISRAPFSCDRSPIATIRSSFTARSPRFAGAPLPSIRRALRMMRSGVGGQGACKAPDASCTGLHSSKSEGGTASIQRISAWHDSADAYADGSDDENKICRSEIRLNAFDMNCVGHIQHGLWTHPRDQSGRFNELQYWVDHAKRLEKGLFDGMFPCRCRRGLRRSGRQPGRGRAERGPGAGQRSDADHPGDGSRHAPPGFRGHLQSHLRAAVPVRAANVDARSSDLRPHRLEHRHRLPRQRRARDRHRGAGRARPAL